MSAAIFTLTFAERAGYDPAHFGQVFYRPKPNVKPIARSVRLIDANVNANACHAGQGRTRARN